MTIFSIAESIVNSAYIFLIDIQEIFIANVAFYS